MELPEAFRLIQLNHQVLKGRLSANDETYMHLLWLHIDGAANHKYIYKRYYDTNKYEEVAK